MRRSIAILALLVAACSKEPPNPAIVVDVRVFDQQMVTLKQSAAVASQRASSTKDFRGRTAADDFKQWVLPKKTLDAIDDLRAKALEQKFPNDARQLLKQASDLANGDINRINEIDNYWNGNLPAPFWRNYWNALFEANHVSVDPPDPALVAIETRMKAALDGGDFAAAAKASGQIGDVLPASMDLAVGRILKAQKGEPAFVPRKTPCAGEKIPPAGDRPKIARAESLEAYYPPDAVKRGEQGTTVLRVDIDPNGCARDVAVAVHSGVPALDDAALKWFEGAQFSPGSTRGAPIESTLVFKVKFVLQDTVPPR
jgi:TonB family protein